LAAVGFVANTQLSAETIDSIKTIYTLAPVVGGVVGIIALCFYTIDEDKVKSNSEKLAQMKANGGSDVVAQ
jgi:Na+/melibiose symporter-like transporter